jgi:hypothetical protein
LASLAEATKVIPAGALARSLDRDPAFADLRAALASSRSASPWLHFDRRRGLESRLILQGEV